MNRQMSINQLKSLDLCVDIYFCDTDIKTVCGGLNRLSPGSDTIKRALLEWIRLCWRNSDAVGFPKRASS